MFATRSRAQHLPPSAPMPPGMFSVPRPEGGYDYYQSPAGTTPRQNDDWDIPTVPHANPIGLSSLYLGRPLPVGSRKVGSGSQAIGSITPMPGAGGKIKGLDAIGAGASGLGGDEAAKLNTLGTMVVLGVVVAVAWYWASK